jgi:hypothetical protein
MFISNICFLFFNYTALISILFELFLCQQNNFNDFLLEFLIEILLEYLPLIIASLKQIIYCR